MTDRFDVFLSYSRADRGAAMALCAQLENQGLTVFRDQEGIREGDLWLNRLQEAIDTCGSFVLLIGRDGVARWVGAETQVALIRHFDPRDEADRLPIFPVLISDTAPDALPAFLRLFEMRRWSAAEPLPDTLISQIRDRTIALAKPIPGEDCPFVGLDAYRIDQAHLFFGRKKETLDALACFDTRPGSPTVRWLEITGNSGSGKSSLMNAGLLPLIDDGWLWPRTGYDDWRRIGPMLPGTQPVGTLCGALATAFGWEKADVRRYVEAEDDRALADWLCSRKPAKGPGDTAFLLAVDQFEELFTVAEVQERRRLDRLLAAALEDPDCPIFMVSTVRADFLDRFDDLPRLSAAQNRAGRSWRLQQIGTNALREVIDGPAALAGLDVGEVRAAMVAEARDEPGALPLVENALYWLWENREGNRLSGQLFTDQGGLAGILSHGADDLLDSLERTERRRALDLLFRLVKVDPEGRRHTRQRMSLGEAVAVAGGGDRGHALIDRLAGMRAIDSGKARGPLRLVTVTREDGKGRAENTGDTQWVNLIHETLIRSKGQDAQSQPRPYWPSLWRYIEDHKDRAARRERLQLLAREWDLRRGLRRVLGLAGLTELWGFRGLGAPGSVERRFLRWSAARASTQAVVVALVASVAGESVYWVLANNFPAEAALARMRHHLGLPKLPVFERMPEGSFMMGSEAREDETPVHQVTFDMPNYLSATEVTFEHWYACLADGGCGGYMPDHETWGLADRPIINVSWHDAQRYVDWLSRRTGVDCRLPSEAEWEYACRAGTETEYALPTPNGSNDIQGRNLANCRDCGSDWDGESTAPVASFEPNAWGIYDMHGNVWEWVEGCWDNYEGAPSDGRRLSEIDDGICARVLRGGSWNNDQDGARCAFRYWFYPNHRLFFVGFRVLCSSPISGD